MKQKSFVVYFKIRGKVPRADMTQKVFFLPKFVTNIAQFEGEYM